jgi:low molecular weight protein-tyrosine phosphatase
MRSVLFLCTGNYYRSRFAEELFNHRAISSAISWRADSRGLALERGTNNKGFMSPFALEGLRDRSVTVANLNRFPLPCTVDDLKSVDRVIALHDGEHRPLMQERFPEWEHRANFWDIEDVQFMKPGLALARLDKQLDDLPRTLDGNT